MMKKILIASVALCAMFACKPSEPALLEHSAKAKKLFENMKSLDGIMFGHQDATVYGHTWYGTADSSDVKRVTGSFPAVYGWELGDLELGKPYSLDSVYFDTIRQRIVEAYLRGGVNTISWHVNNPLTGKNAWDISSDKVVEAVLPGGACDSLYLDYLNKTADFLNSLKAPDGEKIPVLFRPYHEHTGSWFWWGQKLCSVEQYKELWKYTRKVFDAKGVDNILYIYSPASQCDIATYFERYPGDEYVDMLGFDCYYGNAEKAQEYIETSKKWLEMLTAEAAKRGKLACYSETGAESLKEADWWTNRLLPVIENTDIAYVLVWRNACDKENHFYAPYPGQVSADDFLKFKENPRIIFEDRLKSIYE